MPREAAVPMEKIIGVLKDLAIFQTSSKDGPDAQNVILKVEKDPVWDEALSALDHKITRKNLYITLKQNRKKTGDKLGILDKLKAIKLGVKSSDIQTSDVIKKQLEDNDGTEILDDQYDVLHSMALGHRYHGIVKKLSPMEFLMIYFTPEQLDLYRNLIKISGSCVIMIGIAGVIEDFKMRKHQVKDVITHVLGIFFRENFFPVAQTLTEKRGSHIYTNIFMTLMRNNIPPPPHIIVDHLLSCWKAICLALNGMALDQYILQCFNYIMNEKLELPTTVILIDITTPLMFMKNLLDDKPTEVVDFYVESVILLSRLEELDHFKDVVMNLITITLSPSENDLIKNYISLLKSEIDYFDVDSSNLVGREGCKSNIFRGITAPQKVIDFVKSLEETAIRHLEVNSNSDIGSTPNAYYSEKWYYEFFKPFLLEFPLWTRMMVQDDIELDLLQTIQRTVANFARCMSIQKKPIPQFFESSLEMIQQFTHEGRTLLCEQLQEKKQKKPRRVRNFTCLNFQENWMKRTEREGFVIEEITDDTTSQSADIPSVAVPVDSSCTKAPSAKAKAVKKKQGRYTVPHPSISIAHKEMLNKSQRSKREPFIKNGKDLPPEAVNEHKYTLEDTSLFDAIVVLLSFAYKNLKNFQSFCDMRTCLCEPEKCFLQLIKKFALSRTLTGFYNARILFLYTYGERDACDHIRCVDSPRILLSKLMNNHPSCLQSTSCSSCNELSQGELTFVVEVDNLTQKTIENYLESTYFSTENCKTCQRAVTQIQNTLGAYIAIELKNAELEIPLNVMPEYLNILGSTFLLVGSISKFESDGGTRYKSYTRTKEGSWTEYYYKNKKKIVLTVVRKVKLALSLYIKLRSS